MLHKQGDIVAFRTVAAGEKDGESSQIIIGKVVHEDERQNALFIRSSGSGVTCCDFGIYDWEAMTVNAPEDWINQHR